MTAQQPLPDVLEAASAQEAVLLQHPGQDPRHVDELARRSGLPVTDVMGSLAVLELRGLVRQVGRMNYIKAREASARYTPPTL